MLDHLIDSIKTVSLAKHSDKPADAIITSLLQDFVRALKTNTSARPNFTADDEVLFEDDNISIWFCRFQPGATVPPHNHNMTAIIGVYEGTEQNEIFEHTDADQLILRQTTNVTAGEVLQIAPDAFHSVSCVSATPSEAIHVYLGPLTQVDRHLYDVENGTVLAYTDENYHHLSQTKN